MSFIGLCVPHEMARLLSALDIPGDKEPVDTFHVTTLYLGEGVSIEHLSKAVVATYKVTSSTTPFTVLVNRMTSFEPHDEKTPIICPVESPELHHLRTRLMAAFDEAGVVYSNNFPTYKPHVTLGYSKDPAVHSDRTADQDFTTIEWGAAELVLWGGDEGDDRFVGTFPFALSPTRRRQALWRAMVRVARYGQELNSGD